MKKIKFLTLGIASLILTTGCVGDLDVIPIDKKVQVSEVVFENEGAYEQYMAKIYAGITITGNKGTDGAGDVDGIDEGYSSYTRLIYYLNVLSTDEAICGWADKTLPDLVRHTWSSSDTYVKGLYYRIYNEIGYCNEFLRETTAEKLDKRKVSTPVRDEIKYYRGEARLIRALMYYNLLDMFGNVPFVTDEHPVGTYIPEQKQRGDLFAWLEGELISLEAELKQPRTNQYGRVDKGAAWFLLSRLYLNAEVYSGTPRWGDCLTWSKKFEAAGYSLEPNYKKLFFVDNISCTNEIIFPLLYDGINTCSWGGTKFLITGAMAESLNPADYGLSEKGWAGPRSRSTLIDKFGGKNYTRVDLRTYAIITAGSTYENNSEASFSSGYGIVKWSNKTSDGSSYTASSLTQPDTDLAWFRLGEVYLNIAEAALRDGDAGTAYEYIKKIRVRAFGGPDNETEALRGVPSPMTLDYILDERSRELFWEGTRRTDLVRYGQFTNGSYKWPWKGGVKDGAPTESFRNIFPLPSSDVAANMNLQQNPRY